MTQYESVNVIMQSFYKSFTSLFSSRFSYTHLQQCAQVDVAYQRRSMNMLNAAGMALAITLCLRVVPHGLSWFAPVCDDLRFIEMAILEFQVFCMPCLSVFVCEQL